VSTDLGLCKRLLASLERRGGRIMISRNTDTKGDDRCRWAVGYEFGQEEPDNPDNDMVGGAAYGLGPILFQALSAVLEQVGGPTMTERAAEFALRAQRIADTISELIIDLDAAACQLTPKDSFDLEVAAARLTGRLARLEAQP
jgi:hypothetical protein